MVLFDTVLRKLVVHITQKRHFYLVKVCAWCPKDSYPKLHHWQSYTHGLCRKHYSILQKNTSKSLMQFDTDKIISLLFPRQKLA